MLSSPIFDTSVRPIFILGAPRSGTSICTWALGQHPKIQPLPETYWISALAIGAVASYNLGSSRNRYSHLSNVQLPLEPFLIRTGEMVNAVVADVFEERCCRVYGKDYRENTDLNNREFPAEVELKLRRNVSDPKLRWLDGTPMNSLYSWGLIQMFPNALFVHLLRQPHEVVASLMNFENAGGGSYNVDEALTAWIAHEEPAFLVEKALGRNRVFRAEFQRIASDPENLFQEIIEFLDEEWCADCLKPLTKKINSSKIGDNELAKVKKALKNNVTYLHAKTLYDEINAYRLGDGQDDEAAQILKDKFAQACDGKSLIP